MIPAAVFDTACRRLVRKQRKQSIRAIRLQVTPRPAFHMFHISKCYDGALCCNCRVPQSTSSSTRRLASPSRGHRHRPPAAAGPAATCGGSGTCCAMWLEVLDAANLQFNRRWSRKCGCLAGNGSTCSQNRDAMTGIRAHICSVCARCGGQPLIFRSLQVTVITWLPLDIEYFHLAPILTSNSTSSQT